LCQLLRPKLLLLPPKPLPLPPWLLLRYLIAKLYSSMELAS
jgi:hypothetical protein